MEIINLGFGNDQKKTFIASMNKCNPYRMCNITESVYTQIIMKKERMNECKAESLKKQNTIFLPPVKIEIPFVRKGSPRKIFNGSSTLESSNKTDNFQILSKSLDLNIGFNEKLMEMKEKNKQVEKQEVRCLAFREKGSDRKDKYRTMSALESRENSFKVPNKYRETASPWLFQTSKLFHL